MPKNQLSYSLRNGPRKLHSVRGSGFPSISRMASSVPHWSQTYTSAYRDRLFLSMSLFIRACPQRGHGNFSPASCIGFNVSITRFASFSSINLKKAKGTPTSISRAGNSPGCQAVLLSMINPRCVPINIISERTISNDNNLITLHSVFALLPFIGS